jgi:hypothetical protein
MEVTFSIREALRFGWEKTKAHSMLLFQVLITLFALQVAYSIVGHTLQHTLIGILATIALVVAETVVGIGFTIIALKIAEEKSASYRDILPSWEIFWRYILATMLAGLLTVAGFILLVIPGIYLSLRFSMVRFAVLEHTGIWKNLKRSGRLTHGMKWKLLGFFIVMGLLNVVGAICLLVGLLVSIPVTTIAYAHVYKKLSHSRS